MYGNEMDVVYLCALVCAGGLAYVTYIMVTSLTGDPGDSPPHIKQPKYSRNALVRCIVVVAAVLCLQAAVAALTWLYYPPTHNFIPVMASTLEAFALAGHLIILMNGLAKLYALSKTPGELAKRGLLFMTPPLNNI
jgi:hypothetical protein